MKWKLPHISMVILSLILVISLLVHSIFLLWMNINLPPTSGLQGLEIAQRFYLRDLSEQISYIGCWLYNTALAALTIWLLCKRHDIPVRNLLRFLLIQIVILAVCTLPFAVADGSFLGNYLVPVYMVTPVLLCVGIVYGCVALFRFFKLRRRYA